MYESVYAVQNNLSIMYATPFSIKISPFYAICMLKSVFLNRSFTMYFPYNY